MSVKKAHADILDIVVHAIPDAGSVNPSAAAHRFAAEHFDGHTRNVERIEGNWGHVGHDWLWVGEIVLAEDDDYRHSRYRMTFNADRFLWEFRAPLD